jgi:hypothetical protein
MTLGKHNFTNWFPYILTLLCKGSISMMMLAIYSPLTSCSNIIKSFVHQQSPPPPPPPQKPKSTRKIFCNTINQFYCYWKFPKIVTLEYLKIILLFLFWIRVLKCKIGCVVFCMSWHVHNPCSFQLYQKISLFNLLLILSTSIQNDQYNNKCVIIPYTTLYNKL